MITAPRKNSVDTGSSFPPPRSLLNSHFTSNYILPYSQPSFCAPAGARGRRLTAEEGIAGVRSGGGEMPPSLAGLPSEPLRCQGPGEGDFPRLPPFLKVNEGAAPNGGGRGEPGSLLLPGARLLLERQGSPGTPLLAGRPCYRPSPRAGSAVCPVPPPGRAGWLAVLSLPPAGRARAAGRALTAPAE